MVRWLSIRAQKFFLSPGSCCQSRAPPIFAVLGLRGFFFPPFPSLPSLLLCYCPPQDEKKRAVSRVCDGVQFSFSFFFRATTLFTLCFRLPAGRFFHLLQFWKHLLPWWLRGIRRRWPAGPLDQGHTPVAPLPIRIATWLAPSLPVFFFL